MSIGSVRTRPRVLFVFFLSDETHAIGAKEIAPPPIISCARVYNPGGKSCLHFGRSGRTGEVSQCEIVRHHDCCSVF